IVLGCANQRTWERFCRDVVQKPEWVDDSRFLNNSDRKANVEVLEQLIEKVLRTGNNETWLSRCDKAGVPAGPINSFSQVLSDPHFVQRGIVQEFEHPKAGAVKTLGFASKFSETPQEIGQPSPLCGQHTVEVLHDCNIDAARVSTLRNRGVIETADS